jgi:hypothetical protein
LWGLCAVASAIERVCCALQIEGEFPEILGIRESLIKHVFEPAALQVRLFCHIQVQQCALPRFHRCLRPPLASRRRRTVFTKGWKLTARAEI